MSSCGNPNAERDALMARRPKYDRSKACVKCKLKAGNIVIRHAVYCKECFFPLISLRFRRSLEPHINPTPDLHRRKGLKASGNVLIGFSGGLGSAVLLDLVQKTYLLSRDRQEKDQNPNGGCPWPKVFLAFVDISGAMPGIQTEVYSIQQDIEKHGPMIEYLPLKLENAFDKEWWEAVGGFHSYQQHSLNIDNEELFLEKCSHNSSAPGALLQSYLKSFPTQTALANAIRNLIRMLLFHTAASNQCSHILLGTSLTSLSISLISSISQGGGYSVKEEAQEEWVYKDSTQSDRVLRIIRPLQDVGVKECAFWAWWCHLKIVGRHRFSGERQDISALTRDFIVGLERDYPSTVSTIARTCSKLTTKEESSARCLFCERPIQSGIQEWKQSISIWSYHEEAHTKGELPPRVPSPPEMIQDNPNLSAIQNHAITSRICYACHTSWTSRGIRGNGSKESEIPAPVWVGSQLPGGSVWATRKLASKDMKEFIGDLIIGS